MRQDHSSTDIIRAWKVKEYRASLPADVQDGLPAPPANLDQLSDDQLAEAAGALPILTTLGTAALAPMAAGAAADADRAQGLDVGSTADSFQPIA